MFGFLNQACGLECLHLCLVLCKAMEPHKSDMTLNLQSKPKKNHKNKTPLDIAVPGRVKNLLVPSGQLGHPFNGSLQSFSFSLFLGLVFVAVHDGHWKSPFLSVTVIALPSHLSPERCHLLRILL